MIYQAKSRDGNINFGKRFQGKRDERGLCLVCTNMLYKCTYIYMNMYNLHRYTTMYIYMYIKDKNQ